MENDNLDYKAHFKREYEEYRTTIEKTPQLPERDKQLQELDALYKRIMNDQIDPDLRAELEHQSYRRKWGGFTRLESMVTATREKHHDYFEHEKNGFIPSFSKEEINYQFKENFMPYDPNPLLTDKDLSNLGLGNATELREYKPKEPKPSNNENSPTSSALSSKENTTAIYQWTMWGINSLLKSNCISPKVKETLQFVKDEFDKI